MVDTHRLPGRRTPGPQDPGPTIPGSRIPDQSAIGTERVSATGVAIDATGTTAIGTPDGRGGKVVTVYVNATQTDFNFNVNADGVALFDTAQSPGSTTREAFEVSTGNAAFDGDAPDLVFEVTSASATGGATADVDVDVAIESQQ
jgi:hypothetical protein